MWSAPLHILARSNPTKVILQSCVRRHFEEAGASPVWYPVEHNPLGCDAMQSSRSLPRFHDHEAKPLYKHTDRRINTNAKEPMQDGQTGRGAKMFPEDGRSSSPKRPHRAIFFIFTSVTSHTSVRIMSYLSTINPRSPQNTSPCFVCGVYRQNVYRFLHITRKQKHDITVC